MQAGKLGLVEEGWIDDPTDAAYKSTETRTIVEETEFIRMLSVQDTTQATLSTIGTVDVYEGAALWDEEKEPERWYPVGEDVEKRTTTIRERTGTEWAAVPQTGGHDGFALAATSAGTFVFDQLAHNQPVCRIEPAYIDLRSFLEDNRDRLHVWEIGTDSHAGGRVEMHWSDDAMSESEINQAISGQAVITLDASYDDAYRRVSLAQSGWIEVFEPEMETAEFLEVVSEEVLPYAFLAGGDVEATDRIVHEETDVGVQAEDADEEQTSWDDLDTVNVVDGGEDS